MATIGMRWGMFPFLKDTGGVYKDTHVYVILEGLKIFIIFFSRGICLDLNSP
jgi:hypothetical protein|tara:strand:+ start:5293 stop:5448 length:156 start_codon:yes stop_codon:yes gene_type:complete